MIGDEATYSYEPMGFFQDPLRKQVNEGVRINQSIAEGARCTTNELACRVPTRFRTKDRDRKRNGEVRTSRQRRTQRTNKTHTCGSRTY